MNLLASLNEHLGKLVHPEMQSKPVEFLRHKNFLASRLLLSLGTLVAAPLCLALGYAPAAWQAGALAWILLPIGAAAYVSRSGRLAVGEALSIAAWIGLALTITLGSGSAAGLGVLMMVPVEASVAATSTGGPVALLLCGAAAILLPLLTRFGPHLQSDRHALTTGSAIVAASVVYAAILAIMFGRLRELERDQARTAEDRHLALSDAMDDVVLRFDRSGMVDDAGDASQRLFGIKPGDLMGRGLFDHIHVADRPVFLKLVTDVANGMGSRSATVRMRTGVTLAGETADYREPVFAWIELRVRPHDFAGNDAAGRTSKVMGLMRDVTAQKHRDDALEESRQAARRNDAGRDLFLANVSHELRTPLNAIIGFAEMLASESLGPRDPAKQREYASIIQQSGQHLLAVVNSILDASKIESGSFAINPEPFDLGKLVHACCDMVGLRADRSCVDIRREVAADLRDVIGDERACKQILLNLLSNAIKFTPAGGRIAVEARPAGTSVLLTVSDTGIGISARDMPRLGDPFFQAQNSYDRPFDGTGLGLSVVRGLVGLHGGSISIESAPGQGTRVAVRLPSDCRRPSGPAVRASKIETISRYSSSSNPAVGPTDLGRIHKIA